MERSVSGKWVVLGRIASAHGLSGAVKVRLLTDFPERLLDLDRVLVESPALERSAVFTVESAAPLGRLWTVKLAGVDSREAASALTGGLLLVPSRERAVLPEGSYYVDQIIGLAVRDEQGTELGRVTEVLSTGGHDLYVVRREEESRGERGDPAESGQSGGPARPAAEGRSREWLLPAVRDLVIAIDLDEGIMVVRLPEGLTEL